MTGSAFRKAALSLPDAHAEPHFERTSFRVGKKIFATLTADGKEAMIPVRPLERCELMLRADPEVFISYGGWTERNGSLGMRLARVDARLVQALLKESWARVAPKPKKPGR